MSEAKAECFGTTGDHVCVIIEEDGHVHLTSYIGVEDDESLGVLLTKEHAVAMARFILGEETKESNYANTN